MENLTANEARNMTVYTFEYDYEIVENDLYSHVMESADTCTSPRGAENRLHYEENEEGGNTVYEWQRGNSSRRRELDKFETEEEAEDYIFNLVYECEFLHDDRRNCEYYDTREEAEAWYNEMVYGE